MKWTPGGVDSQNSSRIAEGGKWQAAAEGVSQSGDGSPRSARGPVATNRNSVNMPSSPECAHWFSVFCFFGHFVRTTVLGIIFKAETQLSCCHFIHTPLAEASHVTKASVRGWEMRLPTARPGGGTVSSSCWPAKSWPVSPAEPLPARCSGGSAGLSSVFGRCAFHTCFFSSAKPTGHHVPLHQSVWATRESTTARMASTAEMSCLTVPETRSPKSRCLQGGPF